jgi:hypothetical protein
MTVSTHINLRGDWDLNRHALAMTPVDIISFRFLITPSLYAHRKKLGSLHSFHQAAHAAAAPEIRREDPGAAGGHKQDRRRLVIYTDAGACPAGHRV